MTENTTKLSKAEGKTKSDSFSPSLSARYISGAIFLCLVLFTVFYVSMIPFDDENIFENAFSGNSELETLFIAAIYFSFLFLSYWILILVRSIIARLVDDSIPEIYFWAIAGLLISYTIFSIAVEYRLDEGDEIYPLRVFYVLIGTFLSVQLYYRNTASKINFSHHYARAFKFSIIISIISSLSPLFASDEEFSILWLAQFFWVALIVLFFIPQILQLFGILNIHRQESQQRNHLS